MVVWGWEHGDGSLGMWVQGGVLGGECWEGSMGRGEWELDNVDRSMRNWAWGWQPVAGSVMTCMGGKDLFSIILNFFSPFIYFFLPASLKKSKWKLFCFVCCVDCSMGMVASWCAGEGWDNFSSYYFKILLTIYLSLSSAFTEKVHWKRVSEYNISSCAVSRKEEGSGSMVLESGNRSWDGKFEMVASWW